MSDILISVFMILLTLLNLRILRMMKKHPRGTLWDITLVIHFRWQGIGYAEEDEAIGLALGVLTLTIDNPHAP